MLLYICISTHGFGHAARQAAVLNEISRLKPDWRIVISTAVDEEFIRLSMKDFDFEYRKIRWDVGVVQSNALTVDIPSTISHLDLLNKELPDKIKLESKWVRSQKEEVVFISDIPPSAVELASSIKCPIILMGNFGWDDIYTKLGEGFCGFVEKIQAEYKRSDLLLRLPFSLEMNWDLPECNVGLTASKPRPLPDELKNKLNTHKHQIISVGFGGLGFNLNIDCFKKWPDQLFIIPGCKNQTDFSGVKNVLFLPKSCRILDVLPYCSRHLGKPGYSSFCEAIIQDVGMHVVERNSFPESNALINGLMRYGNYRLLSLDSLENGMWELDNNLIPRSNLEVKTDGALLAAKEIIKFSVDYYS